jgi:signal transduction histidine kinase
MTRFLLRLRSLPLRGKVVATVLGAAVAVLGASTYLSFQYWHAESLAAAEQQALMAASSAQATVESALRLGRPEPARHSLALLRSEGTVTSARVYGPSGTILLSADPFEEGRRAGAIWIPDPTELPGGGLVKTSDDGASVRAFLPISIPEPAVLQVGFSMAATKAAMDRGARLGIGLMAVSLLAVVVVVVTMFEREVVAPLQRMDVMLRQSESGDRGEVRAKGTALQDMERSVTRLVRRGREVEARAADQDRRLAATEGLAEVGELAAEMAHEFKRPLASIRMAVSMLQQEYQLDSGGRDMLGAVNSQLELLQGTMQDLFSLAKPVVLEERSVDLAETLDEALAEISGLPGVSGLEIRRQYDHDETTIPGDGRRLRQAFVNVITNAVEATGPRGTVTVEVGRGPDWVDISVSDTGPGLDTDAVEAAVKPFYSTKPQGTGLGLPLVARIVAAHRGGLAIESRPGAGTTVRISLPLDLACGPPHGSA